MIRNHLLLAFRRLRRQRAYAFINVAGLALGLAACGIILLFVRYETSFERVHANADRTYLLQTHGVHWGSARTSFIHPAPLGPAFAEALPDVEHVTRLRGLRARLRHADLNAYQEELFYADPSVFQVFTYPLLEGDAATALNEPHTIVLNEALARTYFGDGEALGETIDVDGEPTRVTGVMADVPPTTQFRPRALVSTATLAADDPDQVESYNISSTLIFFTLRPGGDLAATLAAAPRAMASALEGTEYAEDTFRAQPITRIHLYGMGDPFLNEEAANPIARIQIFAAVAGLILLLACVNYVNLATARSADRAREVGVRKTLGARRGQLARQFLAESVLLALAAGGIALGLVRLGLPLFNHLVGTEMALTAADLPLEAAFLGLALGVGVIAGLYPALALARAEAVGALRGQAPGGVVGVRFRQGLVVFQFAASIALLTCTAVMGRQLSYMEGERLGFEPEQTMMVELYDTPLEDDPAPFLAALDANPAVLQTAVGSSVPGEDGGMFTSITVDGEELPGMMRMYYGDADFLQTLGITLAAGRGFADSLAVDSTTVLLNEAAVRELGWTDPVGRTLEANSETPQEVVGVVRDFHHRSLRGSIEPAVFMPVANHWHQQVVVVRFQAGQTREALAAVEGAWARFAPDHPLQHAFLDERFATLYDTERKLAALFAAFGGLAVLVACLGLFGLAAYTAERRRKEVGIRKALGATVSGLVALLAKDFMKPVAVSAVLAAPVAYLAMQRWLEGFASRAPLGPTPFLVAGGLALALALIAVAGQALRAASTDPVKALRSE